MSNFLSTLKEKNLVIDGAMGTLLMNAGVRPEEGFDLQVLKNPEIVKSIHKSYIDAGADIIETCTFGANRLKLADYNAQDKVKEININAVKIAREAGHAFVCGSIGPLGKLLAPFGDVTFKEALEIFREQAMALEEGGTDCISIETISDLQEMRAAVIAVKQNTKLPIIASMTFDKNQKTIFGTPPEVVACVLESLGADVISANCSTGPEGLLKIAKRYINSTSLPVMVMPNAGMPVIEKNKAVYKMSPEKFGQFANQFLKLGVKIIGGCCGTTPEHIAQVKLQVLKYKVQNTKNNQSHKTRFASRTKTVEFNPKKLLIIGERINPTGKKVFQDEIKAGNFRIVREEASIQTKSGADILDLNISIPAGDDKSSMLNAVNAASSASDLPLSIDSPSPQVLETGLSEFCGKALLNSVNGKKESIEKFLPLAKKYGAAIIALALDEKGLPKTIDEKIIIAGRIITAALNAGIPKEDIFVDLLVITAGVNIGAAFETLKAIPIIKSKFNIKTSLGVSNVSHGLPNRPKINALYLKLARLYGLDAAIVDITDKEIKKAIKEINVFKGSRNALIKKLTKQFSNEISKVGLKRESVSAYKAKENIFKNIKDIENAVVFGDKEKTVLFTKQALEKKHAPQKIINGALIPGMEIVGRCFLKKKYFLPQVLSSASAMAAGFELCKRKIPKKSIKIAGKIILATVKGDIHDIGKNILKMMLENHGFEVIDLGKDVPPEKIIEAAKKINPNLIALSALLTTTMVEMAVVKEELKKANLNIPLLVGGAVVTRDYAEDIGAEYGLDAVSAVELAKNIIKNLI
ncbi:MAG: 5-methyltetrahydrofolate--homocysteine methyltransferase [Candidatus Saganbacteria bacterium]|uniref:Methionine synthase n=1 Tax=Candidatus Saganbacteria bacterium TaxID=2575572 RepID=A0A833L0F1_UNCSA|nr:MAG: 5-methyltetrahydrofolate--homocysteine methyltransferase [Candidatus Saganbacteria bacterium]